MILSALFILFTITLFVFLNFRNKIIHALVVNFLSIVAMMLVAVMYISKISTYRFVVQTDYQLYLWLSTFKLSISEIVRMFNVSFALFMLSGVLFIRALNRMKWQSVCFLSLPVVFFIIINDPYISLNAHVTLLSAGDGLRLNRFIEFCRYSSRTIFYAYILAPIVSVVYYCLKTHIHIKRKNAIIMGLCIFLVDVFVLVVFAFGTFRHVMFDRVDFVKLPTMTSVDSGYIMSPVLSMVVIISVSALILYFKPFSSFSIVRKIEVAQKTKSLNANISMLLHVYKNAFLAMGQQFELVKFSVGKNETPEIVASYASVGVGIADEFVDMLDNTLSLMRNTRFKDDRIHLKDCIESAIEKVGVPPNINLIFNEGDDACIKGDSFHMTEVFVNLFNNAVEALKSKYCDAGEIKVDMVNEGDFCMVTVADNGCGIAKNNLKKLFNLFYTTKAPTKGGGVGLNYVDNVIRQHNGEIRIVSKVNQFTMFQIILPVAD